MRYTVTRKAELITAGWAGGTTTQLAIFPTTATYQEFNFDFRISYATVKVPESTFTFMPGVTRHLMILEGSLEIDHTDRYSKKLEPFDVDVFNGEWPTTAKGMVTDFNLMTRGKAAGKVERLLLDRGHAQEIIHSSGYTGIYVWQGKTGIVAGKDAMEMETGDFILFSDAEAPPISLLSDEESIVIISRVSSW